MEEHGLAIVALDRFASHLAKQFAEGSPQLHVATDESNRRE
jgi:hypothetical protein